MSATDGRRYYKKMARVGVNGQEINEVGKGRAFIRSLQKKNAHPKPGIKGRFGKHCGTDPQVRVIENGRKGVPPWGGGVGGGWGGGGEGVGGGGGGGGLVGGGGLFGSREITGRANNFIVRNLNPMRHE